MNTSSTALAQPQSHTSTTSTTPQLQIEEKIYKKEKQILFEFDLKTKDLKNQLNEGVKCLEQRLDTQISFVYELQDFFKKRAEVELQYSKDLDKLVKQIQAKHKSEKSRRETWNLYSTMQLWESLLNDTKNHSKYHQVLSEICSKYVSDKFDEIADDARRIFNKAMKTYHEYQSDSKQAEAKLKYVQSQKPKYEKQKNQKKLKQFEKQIEKRQQKYTETKIKAFKARNEYILGINSANACVSKHCTEDIGDMIDCIDFGFHGSIAKCIYMYTSGQDNIKRSRQLTIDNLSRSVGDLDSNADKQNYLDYYSPIFNIQKKFNFEPHKGDEVSQVNAQSLIRYDMEKRYEQLDYRLNTLKTENDEIFKTIEATEQSLLNYFDLKHTDMSDLFKDLYLPNSQNSKEKRVEIEDYYIEKVRQYTISSNLIARLEARQQMMKKALSTAADRQTQQEAQLQVSKDQVRPKKKIGKSPMIGQPRLFGGKLTEYINATKQEIPLVIESCIKAINRLGLHNQGIFRIPGSLVEINQFKDSFEKGEDPLITVNPREMNSVAGVLKLYFRELKDPLFPRDMFDTFMVCMKTGPECESIEQHETQRIDNIRKAIQNVPVQIVIVMRYFFAFLNHLSEYKDENMMDSYNIAVCLAPTLIPIPEDKKDQVTNYQTDSIELIKLIIQNNNQIFPVELHDGPVYEKFDVECDSDDNIDTEEEDESEKQFFRSLSDDEFCNIEAVALYDYKGRTDKELSFRKGDRLLIKNQLSADWWLGSTDVDDGKCGYIPDKYIALRNTKRKESNISYDFDLTKSNLSELMKSKESDIINDSELTDAKSLHTSTIKKAEKSQQKEEFNEFQKQKMSYIEHALTSVLNDMKQLDLKNSSHNSNGKNRNGRNEDDDGDYDEPPDNDDEYDDNLKDTSSNELLSTSSSTSTNTLPVFSGDIQLKISQPSGQQSLVLNKSSDKPDLVIDLPANESIRSTNTTPSYDTRQHVLPIVASACIISPPSSLPATTSKLLDTLSLTRKTSTPTRVDNYISCTKSNSTFEIEITKPSPPQKKQPPPIIGKKPDKTDEILRRLNRKPSDSTLNSINVPKSKATDV